MKRNQKGFTLVELLAVIVILAVVMLIGVTAIGPLLNDTRENALRSEGQGLVSAAEIAYQSLQLDPSSGITGTQSACFDVSYLVDKGYFQRKDSSLDGSVLVNVSGNVYTYTYWATNKAVGKIITGVSTELEKHTEVADTVKEASGCPGASVTNKFSSAS